MYLLKINFEDLYEILGASDLKRLYAKLILWINSDVQNNLVSEPQNILK